VKGVLAEVDGPHVCVADDLARGISPLVELGLDAKAGRCARVPNQFDHGFPGAERLAAPVLRDVAEEAVLDLVPLARPGGKWLTRMRNLVSLASACNSTFHAVSDSHCCRRRRR